MAGKVVNSSFLLLSKFGASRQESTSKTATSHIRKPLPASKKQRLKPKEMIENNIEFIKQVIEKNIPIHNFLGLKLLVIEKGFVRVSVPFRDEVVQKSNTWVVSFR